MILEKGTISPSPTQLSSWSLDFFLKRPLSSKRNKMSTSQVEIHVSVSDLAKMDLFSKSDPFCVLFSIHNKIRREISRTETLDNTHDTSFSKSFVLDYYFEEHQQFILAVYDSDAETRDLEHHDFIGEYGFTLGSLMTSPGIHLKGKLVRPLMQNTNEQRGDVLLRGEETDMCSDMISMSWKGVGLDQMNGWFGLFGKSDPFLRFSRAREDGSYVQVDCSETITNNLNPIWKERKIKAQTLANGDSQR